MQLFDKVTGILYHTEFYQRYMKYWPEPLNDASFDTFMIFVFVLMVLIPEIYSRIYDYLAYRRIRRKNREYLNEAKSSKKQGKPTKDMELMDQYLKFLLVANFIDKRMDISFEEWKEAKYGGSEMDTVKKENEKEISKGPGFIRFLLPAGKPLVKGKKADKEESVKRKKLFERREKIKEIEESKKKIDDEAKDLETGDYFIKEEQKPQSSFEDYIPNKDVSDPEIQEEDADEFERILDSIKQKRYEKQTMRNRLMEMADSEKKKRQSIEEKFDIIKGAGEPDIEKATEEPRVYDAKAAALKLKEKEKLRQKKLMEKRQKREAGGMEALWQAK